MGPLEGAWMLYRAAGGSGQRKLNLLAPEAEGYTGAYLSKAFGGKGCLYIVPIQETLDTSPLPYSSKEFEKMPKARCTNCSENMPVQLLALHVQKCERKSSVDSIDFEQNLAVDVTTALDCPPLINPGNASPTLLTSTSPSHKMDVKVACPLCYKMFPENFVEIHASTCKDSAFSETDIIDLDEEKDAVEDEQKEIVKKSVSVAEAISTLAACVDTTATFNICVTREDMFERGMKQWRRQKRASPKNSLRVSFLGEAGIDAGALRLEFLTEMMRGVETTYFQGGHTGKTPKYSITDYQKENFKTVGEIIAVSIAQGGPPPNFFKEWCYSYITTGEIDKEIISKEDVTDPELRHFMEEIEMAEPDALIDLIDRMVACGYSGPVTHEKRDAILKAIVLHSCVRVLPMLQQICSGMKLFGLCELIVEQPRNFRQLFVPGLLGKPDSDFLMGCIFPNFSKPGSLRYKKESKIVNYLQDFIQHMDDDELQSNDVEMKENNKSDEVEKENDSNEVEDKNQKNEVEKDVNQDENQKDDVENDENQKDEDEKDKNDEVQMKSKCDESLMITVSSFLQWLTGQAHLPTTSTERNRFRIEIEFDHDCEVRYGKHIICFPIVNACTNSITFPTKHLNSYPEFASIMKQAFHYGKGFGRP